MYKILMNFNVSRSIKERFDLICRENGRTMTSVLVELMTNYLISEGTRLADRQALLPDIDAALQKSRGLRDSHREMYHDDQFTHSARQTWADDDLGLPSPMLSDGREDW
jgi:hypothetical protein